MKRYAFILLFSITVFFCYGQSVIAQTANLAQVKKKLKVLAIQTVKAGCQNCKVSVECKWISPKISSTPADGIAGLYFDEPGMPGGYVNASVDLKGTDPTVKGAVQMYITIQKKVPVASTRIERGAIIEAQDWIWRWKDITRLNRQPVSSKKFFRNKAASHMISAGDIIFTTDLVGRHSIRPGDRVVMLYKEKGVRIKIDCIVRNVKSKRNKIRLYSRETGQRYLANIANQDKIFWVKTL